MCTEKDDGVDRVSSIMEWSKNAPAHKALLLTLSHQSTKQNVFSSQNTIGWIPRRMLHPPPPTPSCEYKMQCNICFARIDYLFSYLNSFIFLVISTPFTRYFQYADK